MDREILLSAAKVFLLSCFSDNQVYQPSDLDENILGGLDVSGLLSFSGPIWNRTIFCKALGDLVDEGKIKAWEDDRQWYYQLVVS